MFRPISTKTHGALDYLSVGILCALPRALGWEREVTRLLTGAASGTLIYSLLTRYELGAIKVLPMPAHLALDGLSGMLLCAAPRRLDSQGKGASPALVCLGVFEIGAALLSKTRPAVG